MKKDNKRSLEITKQYLDFLDHHINDATNRLHNKIIPIINQTKPRIAKELH